MKKKVFFIMSTDDYSGAEAVNFAIIDGLKDKYDFYWVSRSGNINTFLNEKGYNWIEINELSKREIKRIINQYKPDILHATDYRASVITCMAAKKIPVIAHLHNNSPWIEKLCINSLALLYVGYKAKYVLTVSDAIENEYIFSKIIKKKIKMVDNPISCEKILQQVKKNNQKEKEYDVCMTARLTEPKNPLLFIRIIKKLSENNKDIKALMIGDGELKTQCIDEIKKLKLENNIVLAGFVKNPYEEMVKAKVFCLTSQWEGFGLVAFEALTLGLPAVVSNVGGLGSIVDKSCGMLCDKDDDFYCEIKKLLTDESYYNIKSRNAINKAYRIENNEKYMRGIDKIYKDL